MFGSAEFPDLGTSGEFPGGEVPVVFRGIFGEFLRTSGVCTSAEPRTVGPSSGVEAWSGSSSSSCASTGITSPMAKCLIASQGGSSFPKTFRSTCYT